jgi:hypothetical protein
MSLFNGFDDEDGEKPKINLKANGKKSSMELDVDFDDYVRSFITLSEVGRYVLFSYTDDDSIIVVDKGSLEFCIDRMRDMFELAPIPNGLCILSIEQFSEVVE